MLKRKNLLVYPKFQNKLLAIIVVSMLFIFLVVGVEQYFSYLKLVDMGVEANLKENHAYYKFVNFQFKNNLFYLLISFLISSVFSLGAALLVSHRMAGPLVRLKSYFSDLAKAENKSSISNLKFRKNDYLQDLAPIINEAIAKIRKS